MSARKDLQKKTFSHAHEICPLFNTDPSFMCINARRLIWLKFEPPRHWAKFIAELLTDLVAC